MQKTKKRIVACLCTISILVSVTVTAYAAGAGSTKYIHSTTLAKNLSYINTVHWNDDYGREESYTLRYTPGGDAYPIVIKDETVYGRVDMQYVLNYAEKTRGRNILAATNADFLSAKTGIPLGLFIEDGIYKSSNEIENAVGFRADGTAFVSETPKVTITLSNETNGATTNVNHLNKYLYVSGVPYLFSSDFSSVSTRADEGPCWYVRFRIIEGKLSIGGEMKLEVTEKVKKGGSVPIGEGYLILSSLGEINANFSNFTIGDVVSLSVTTSDDNLYNAQYVAGTGDVLLRNGEITDIKLWDKDLLTRSPKTAIGLTAAGEVVVYVVDGRNKNYGNGLTLYDLAVEMKALGCVIALNLDGGGSSIMAVRTPGTTAAVTVNRPSDGVPRKVSTYLAFATDNVSDGVARNLALKNDGAIVLAGSSINLSFTATDSAFRPATTPNNIVAKSYSSAVIESINGVQYYTAGVICGADKLSLYSDKAGAVGTGEIFVLITPTSITPMDAKGKELLDIRLAPGDVLSINPVATFYQKDVVSQPHSYSYSVSNDIGTVSSDGIFTAATIGNRSGTVSVAAGNASASFKLTVTGFEDIVGHWAYDHINSLYAKGVVSGTSATTFSPEINMGRADFITMLYNAVGRPPLSDIDSFADVPSDKYYAAAVAWAKESGVISDTDGDRFMPDKPITREQTFIFAYRALPALGIVVPNGLSPDLTGFSDVSEMDENAVIPVDTLSALKIISGSGGKLMPKDPFTRAQMAAMLSNLLSLQPALATN